MISKEEVLQLLHSTETFRVERTTALRDMDKFQEAICAFSNDLPDARKKGYLIIGAYDDGSLSGLKVDDNLLKTISSIRSNGNILPLPVMSVERFEYEDGDLLVAEVSPSLVPPVRYRGIERVTTMLKENGNPDPIFAVDKITVFEATVKPSTSFFTEEDCPENAEIAQKIAQKITQKNVRRTFLAIIEHPNATIAELSETLGIAERTIKNHIAALRGNFIKRVGSDKKGYWAIITDSNN